MKRRIRIIAIWIMRVLLMVLLSCIYAMQTPFVQTTFTLSALQKLGESLEGEVEYEELRVLPSGVFYLKNLSIVDKEPQMEEADTLFRAKLISGTFNVTSIFKKGRGVYLNRVNMSDALFHLTSEAGDYSTNLTRMFRIPKSSGERPEPGPEIFRIRRANVKELRFRLSNLRQESSKEEISGIDYWDLDLKANINGHGLRFDGGRMYAIADRLTLSEKSGYKILNASGRCAVGQGVALVEDFRLSDPWSRLRVKSFSMSYERRGAFKNFMEEALMECELRPSTLGTPTIKYLALGLLDGIESELQLNSCHFKGYVRDFKVEKLNFRDSKNEIRGIISAQIAGLPNYKDLTGSVGVEQLSFETKTLDSLLGIWLPGNNFPKLSQYAKGVSFILDAEAEGHMDNFSLQANLASSEGDIAVNAQILNLFSRNQATEITTSLTTNQLFISKLYEELPFENCSLEAKAYGRIDNGMSRFEIERLDVSSIRFSDQDYFGISAVGSFIDKRLLLRVGSRDPELDFDIFTSAIFETEEDRTELRIKGIIENVDLRKLGIYSKDLFKVGLELETDLISDNGMLHGFAIMNNLRISSENGYVEIENLDFRACNREGKQSFEFSSPFLDISFLGSKSLKNLFGALQTSSIAKHLPSLYSVQPEGEFEGLTAEVKFSFHDSRELLSALKPGLYIDDDTRGSIYLKENGDIEGKLNSSRIALGKKYLRNFYIDLNSNESYMAACVSGRELRLDNITVETPWIRASAFNDKFSLETSFAKLAGKNCEGQLCMRGTIARDSLGIFSVQAKPDDSYIVLNGNFWDVDGAGLEYHDKNLRIGGLRMARKEQFISVEGAYSKTRSDTLTLLAQNIDLSILNGFVNNVPHIRGKAVGRALLTSSKSSLPGILANVRLDSLWMESTDLGRIRIASSLEEGNDKIRIIMRHNIGDRLTLSADGNYGTGDANLNLLLQLDSLPLEITKAFLPAAFEKISGSVSGELNLNKIASNVSLSGKGLRLNDASTRLGITGVDYKLEGSLAFDNNAIYFDNLCFSEASGGTADLSGSLRHENFKNMRMNANISLNRLKLLNKTNDRNGGIYGNLNANGNISLRGPLRNMTINADLRSTGRGNVHLTYPESISSSNSNLLNFTEPVVIMDEYEEMLQELIEKEQEANALNMYVRIGLDPSTTIFIEQSASSMSSFNGDGNINLHFASNSPIELEGDFAISEGNYTFSIPGILNKDFEIQDGSSIKFNGDLPNSEVDIYAIYRLRTSLSTLLSESYSDQSISTSREVECGIRISDRLSNPRMSFSVNIPDLNPTVKSQVESVLNTDDKVQKQFLALLLMGTFFPDEQSGVANSSDILFSNMSELMSTQLNSILQKLEIPVDVGIGYQSLSSGSNLFDVAISTQLFNNRVIVGGNVGNRQYSSSNETNGDIIGDLDIQIKLDPQGKFRLNLFSHSADEYSNYLDYSQRNGVGISYQKEYSRLGDFIRSIFSRKKYRQQQEEKRRNNTEDKQSVINIGARNEE